MQCKLPNSKHRLVPGRHLHCGRS